MDAIKLKTGMVRTVFLNDIDTMTAVVEQPYIVFSKNEFSMHALANILATLNKKVKRAGFLNSFRKQFTAQECEINLNSVYEEGRVDLPEIHRPLVIFSSGFDKKTLVIIKILKVRGWDEFLPIQTSEVSSLEAIKKEVEGTKIEESVDYIIFGPVNVTVASGFKETIVSQQKLKQILAEFPEIIVKENPKDELFFEGLRPESENKF